MRVGSNIMGEFDKGVFYDRSKTLRELDREAEEKKQEEMGEEE